MLNREYRGAFFIDSSDLGVIAGWNKTGLVRGVTTNPKIMLNDGVSLEDYRPTIEGICEMMGTRPVSVELMDSRASVDDMLYEARDLAKISRNVTIKVPLIPDRPEKCLEVMHRLAVEESIPVNATVGMTFEGLTMMAGALRGTKVTSFVSQFYCRGGEDWKMRQDKEKYAPRRLKIGDGADVNSNPARLTRGIVRYLENDLGLRRVSLIVGSIRGSSHVGEALEAGAHIVTVTPPVLEAMVYSRRGVETVKAFDKDAREVRAR